MTLWHYPPSPRQKMSLSLFLHCLSLFSFLLNWNTGFRANVSWELYVSCPLFNSKFILVFFLLNLQINPVFLIRFFIFTSRISLSYWCLPFCFLFLCTNLSRPSGNGFTNRIYCKADYVLIYTNDKSKTQCQKNKKMQSRIYYSPITIQLGK